MKIRLKSLLTILVFVLLYATYYWVVPLVVDIQSRVGLIESIAKKNFGTEIKIKNPSLKMGLSPSLWVDASYFEIVDKKTSPLRIVNPRLKIRLLPLFLGKVDLAYFSCDNIKADFKLDKDYRFYIGDYLIIKNANPILSINSSKMDIEGYEIKLKDEIQNKMIILNGDYFDLEQYKAKQRLTFSTNSKLKIDNRYSTINANVDFKLPLKKSFESNEIVFDGTITNLNFADFSPYIKKLSKGKIKKTTGILNIEADTKDLNRRTKRITTQMAIENLSIIGKDKPSSIYFKNKLNATTVCDVSKNTLLIKKFQLSSGKMHLNIAGKINKISSRNPVLDLAVVINKSRLEDFISLLPAVNLKNVDLNIIALKKYGYYSDIEGKLLIKGKSDRPRLTGQFLSSNGYVIKPLPAYIPKATVLIKFLGEKLFMDINVPITQSEKVSVKGHIDLYGDKNSLIDVKSTPAVDLQTTESILNPLHEMFYFELGPLPVMQLQGIGNIELKIKGTKQDPHIVGILNFKNATASFNGINMLIKGIEGKLYFKDKDTHLITNKAYFDNKPIKVDGKCSFAGILDYDITANGQELDKLLGILKDSPLLSSIQKAIPPLKKAGGKLNVALKLSGKIKNINDFELGKTIIASGDVKLLGVNISLNSLQIPIENLFGNIKFKNNNADFDLYSVVEKSRIHTKGNVKNGVFYSKIKLDDMAFLYSNIPVKIFSGNIEIRNNKLTLYKVNAVLDSMPILIDGLVTDIFKDPNFNIYVNSKPSQKFIEKYINKNTMYPLKIKGDIIYSSRIQGTKDSFNTKTEINLQEDSNIYYMGSTLGDLNDPIRIFLDANVTKTPNRHSIYVNNFQYDKLISSQNNKEFVSQQLNAKGQINIYKNDINFQALRIRTQNPTDARVFNIIFKKPLIKQGMFTSNAILNGPITSPKILGFLNFNGINIPLLDTTIKDISLDFGDRIIDIKSKGEIFSNQITILADMENRLTAPFVINNADIYLGNLDINEIVKSINKLDIQTEMSNLSEQKSENAPPSNFNITNLIIKDAKLKADSVFVKNIFAKDFTAAFSLNEKLLFALKNFKFDVAQGSVNGNFKYNLLNSNSALELHVDGVNANNMSEALFDLQNQIFGSLTGEVDLVCNGKTHKTCMDTLSGTGGFRVADGRMPKLGSLEYLLKAGNLIKSGVTGITINSVLELVSPLKTGQFETINGTFTIKSGIANSIQIFSKGKDLSLFLTGTYNFSTFIADMEVFGRISKKISNALGPVGNTSLNTLFNTIPGLNLDESNKTEFIKNFNKIPGFELNDKTYRIFSSEIYGDINGDNYVKSFKWIE